MIRDVIWESSYLFIFFPSSSIAHPVHNMLLFLDTPLFFREWGRGNGMRLVARLESSVNIIPFSVVFQSHISPRVSKFSLSLYAIVNYYYYYCLLVIFPIQLFGYKL